MDSPAMDPRDEPAVEGQPPPDLLTELGPLAYGLFALSEPGPLAGIRSWDESRTAPVPAGARRPLEGERAGCGALLEELGALDL